MSLAPLQHRNAGDKASEVRTWMAKAYAPDLTLSPVLRDLEQKLRRQFACTCPSNSLKTSPRHALKTGSRFHSRALKKEAPLRAPKVLKVLCKPGRLPARDLSPSARRVCAAVPHDSAASDLSKFPQRCPGLGCSDHWRRWFCQFVRMFFCCFRSKVLPQETRADKSKHMSNRCSKAS